MKDFAIFIARLCLSAIFLWASWRKMMNWKGTLSMMKGKKIPFPKLLLPGAVALQILGVVSLMLGLFPRIGALLLILFTLPAMITMHDFWNTKGKERVMETAMFLKDVAIIGGLLLLIALGGGAISL
jgi:putative oxidoreductase